MKVDDKNKKEALEHEKQAKSAPVRFLHYIFVHNIAYKMLAVILSATLWILSTGL